MHVRSSYLVVERPSMSESAYQDLNGHPRIINFKSMDMISALADHPVPLRLATADAPSSCAAQHVYFPNKDGIQLIICTPCRTTEWWVGNESGNMLMVPMKSGTTLISIHQAGMLLISAGDCTIRITSDPRVTVIPIAPNPVCANLLMG
jgi:hypothetical protein